MNTGALAGERLGRWTLVENLGSGGFGSVWRVEDDNRYTAALKLLPAAQGGELRALGQVCHPAIPSLLDASGGGRPFIVTELAQGRSLTRMLRAGRAPESAAISILAILADALAAVHHAGLVHGDVKPDNVIVNSVRHREMTLVDFGVVDPAEGGTLPYASPERLSGAQPSAASDVYALGLIAYEMLHGRLPWSELGLSATLVRRKKEVPEVTAGPDWLRRLLEGMLAVEPGDRLDADAVAEACAAEGAALPSPGPDLLRLRASRVHIPRRRVDDALAVWRESGGVLAFVGPPGSGRTHILERTALELRADGQPMLHLVDIGEPWGPIRAALESPELTNPPAVLPQDPDPDQRATACAALLEDRSPDLLNLLVDDIGSLDAGTRRTLQRLAERGRVRILLTTAEPVPWATATVVLEELDADGVQELVQGVLGVGASLDVVADQMHILSGGWPGIVVELLVSACQAQVLVRRNQRWLVGDGWMEELLACGELAGPPVPPQTDEATVGGFVSLVRGALALSDVAEMTGLSAERVARAAHRLVRRRFVFVEGGQVRCVSRLAATQLSGLVVEPREAHARLLAWLDRKRIDDPFRLAEHILGAEDGVRCESSGPSLIEAAGIVDRVAAARMADRFWAMWPHRCLVVPRMDALAAVGQIEAAVELGRSVLEDGLPENEQVQVWTAMGHAWLREEGRESEALACVASAHEGLREGEAPGLSLMVLEAQARFDMDDPAGVIDVAQRVRAMAAPPETRDLDGWLVLHGLLARALEQTERRSEGIELLEGLPVGTGSGRPARARLDSVLGQLYWSAGRVAEAARAIGRAGAPGSGLAGIDRARSLHNAGLAHFVGGERLRALECWEAALLLFSRLDAPTEQIRVSTSLCIGYRRAGRWERGRQAGVQAVEWAATHDHPELEAVAAGCLGDLLLAQNLLDETHHWYRHARLIATRNELSGELAELAKRDAELAVLQGSSDAMRKCVKAVWRAEQGEDRALLARAWALKAVCHGRLQEVGPMQALLDEAVAALRENGSAIDRAWVHLLSAEAHHAAGSEQQARQECDEVLVQARALEHVPLRTRAERLLEKLARDDRRSDKVSLLLELAVSVARERELDGVVGALAQASLTLIGGERAFVLLIEEDTVLVKSRAAADGDEPSSLPSMAVVERCIDRRAEVVVADATGSDWMEGAEPADGGPATSVICVPLVDGDVVLGAVYVEAGEASEEALLQSALFMQALASYGTIAVVNARNLAALAGHAAWARGIAHDMKSPINSMIALSRELDPEDVQSVETVRRDLQTLGRRAVQLAQGFLDGESLVPRPKSIDLSAFAGESLRLLMPRAKVARVELLLDIQPGLRIMGDKTVLDRILGNVVGNALKYSEPGGRVWVSVSADDGMARLVVLDEGRGIAEGAEEAIWGDGVQGDGAVDGHGVGLALVRSMVEGMGGAVAARNHPEHGAEFTLTIPLADER